MRRGLSSSAWLVHEAVDPAETGGAVEEKGAYR